MIVQRFFSIFFITSSPLTINRKRRIVPKLTRYSYKNISYIHLFVYVLMHINCVFFIYLLKISKIGKINADVF